jgi:hypothetical protein
VHHPDGLRLHIIGNTTDPSKVVLKFTRTKGVLVLDGNALGMLNGVTVQGDGTNNCITAENDAFITLGENTVVEKCNLGIVVVQQSVVSAFNVVTQDNLLDGILVVRGSTFLASKVLSQRNGRYGVQFVQGSHVYLEDSTFNANGWVGVQGNHVSSAVVVRGNASGNGIAPYSPALNTFANDGTIILN